MLVMMMVVMMRVVVQDAATDGYGDDDGDDDDTNLTQLVRCVHLPSLTTRPGLIELLSL